MKKDKPVLTQPPVSDKTTVPTPDNTVTRPDERVDRTEDTSRLDDAATGSDKTVEQETVSAGTTGGESSSDSDKPAPDGKDTPAPEGEGSDKSASDAPVTESREPAGDEETRVGPNEAPALLKPPASGARQAVTEPPRPSRLPLAISLLALIGVGLIGWQVWELRMLSKETRQEVAQRLSTGDNAVSEIRALTRQQQEQIAAFQGRFGALESQVAETEGQAVALESLYMEYSRSRSDQALAEVEQAINIAAQQLQLAGNFEAGLIALQGAEARLATPDQGHLQALRRALIRDIEELKSHPQVDVSGLALKLEILMDRADRLPLAFEVQLEQQQAALAQAKVEREAVDGGEGYLYEGLAYARALSADIWSEVKGMVRLERMDSDDPVLLAPAQSTYLRENVKIRLLTARLALLARDGSTFASDLAMAKEWIERYFDPEDEQVQRVIADLADLSQTPIKAELPTLTETFAALRLVQARTSQRPVGEPVDTPPAPAAGEGAR